MNQPDCYTKGLEIRPMDGVNGAFQGFLLLGYSFIPLHLPLTYINEPKALVTVTTRISLNGMGRQLRGYIGRCVGHGNITI
jgi:hypothetical protein